MTRISLTNLEPIRLQQLPTQAPGQSVLGQLTPGQILTAQVVRSLGAGRFLLNLQGSQLVATSNSPLTSGQQLSLQVSSNKDGQASVHVLTLAEGAVAEAAGKPNAQGLDQRVQTAFGKLTDQLPRTSTTTTAEPSTTDRVAQLLRTDGPLRQLLAERPDLGPRIDALLSRIANRPSGLGEDLNQLQTELTRLLDRLPANQQPPIANAQSRLAKLIFPPELLDEPEQLAQNLVSKFETFAKGFESTLHRALGEETQEANKRAAEIHVQSEKSQPDRVSPERAADSGRLIQRTFESDLKGQLLELRTQLQQLQNQSPGNPSLSAAIARTDALLEQVTAQQVRNLDGLNQYAYAEIPVDPKTGIREARLQVFYRNRNQSARAADAEVDRFTIAMFLNMTRLGDVMTVVSSVEGSLSVNFTVNNEAADELLTQQADNLREALSQAGHPLATVTVRTATPPTHATGTETWDEFLSLPIPPGGAGERLDSEA